MEDYTARATAHVRWAERYNKTGNPKKAVAHFGRALEYDKRAHAAHGRRICAVKRADPAAFGTRAYGTRTQTEKGGPSTNYRPSTT